MAKDPQVRQDTVTPYGFKLCDRIVRAAIINENDFSPGQLPKDIGNFLTDRPNIRPFVQYCRDNGDNGTVVRPIT
ncbi:hypothetical protein Geu3261_0035_017 [Komagataeibacter europaeus NBRC 3261]|uniref:Uncharacterized protein n=1 Tax=Komagataeibacter europaeus NBRC 3261 TaxID=1234669 RepID=A0A0D6PY08_KOMEU|nr:hypothetical protein Geu3261_0035_017 [Komagataeibacter europaeus NBRC 3261]